MAISFHLVDTDDNSGGADQLNFPGESSGETDWVIVHGSIWVNNFATVQAVTTPVGWTEVFNDIVAGTSRRIVLAYRIGDYTGDAAWIATSATNLTASGSCAKYRGVLGGVGSQSLQHDAAAEDATAPSRPDAEIGDWLVVLGGGGQASVADLGFTTPSGFTLRQSIGNNTEADAVRLNFYDDTLAAAGATGAVVLDQSTPGTAVGERVGWSLLLKALAPGGWSVGSIRF